MALVLVFGCGAQEATLAEGPNDAAVVPDSQESELRESGPREFTVYDSSDQYSAPVVILELIRLEAQDRCLPRSLSNDAGSDLIDCRILLQVASGCHALGLQEAAMSDAIAIARRADVSPGTICQLAQLPGGTSCKAATPAGWCYVNGACFSDAGRTCNQAICASSGFDVQNVIYDAAWLECR